MLVSPYIGWVILAAALAAGLRLKPHWLLTGLIALLPLVAWLDVQRGAHPPASALIAAGLLLAATIRRVMSPTAAADRHGARQWWWAFALFALGQALALFWLMPFPGNGAALSALARALPQLYAGNANYYEYVLSAAAQLLVIPVAAGALAALLAGAPQAGLIRATRLGFQGALLTGAGFVIAGLAGGDGSALRKGYRFTAGLPDPNSAGTFYLLVCAALLATLPAGGGTGKRAMNRKDAVIHGCGLLLACLLLLATGSRVALFALPLVAAFHLYQRGFALKKILAWAPLAAAGAFGMLFLAYQLDQRALIPFIHPGAVTHLYQALTPDYIASQGLAFRGAYWRADLRAWLDAPLSGIGVGRLYGAMGQYMRNMPWPVQYFHENAHNQWLQWLAELGLTGFAIAAVAQVRSWRAAPPHARLLLLAFALTALTGHPLLVPAMAFLLGLILALPGDPAAAIPDRPHAVARWRRWWPLAALPLGMWVARPRFSFIGHVRGEGIAQPEAQARWSMSCPLWKVIHPGDPPLPARLADPAARRGSITLLAPPPVNPVPGGVFILPVRVSNLSTQTWPAQQDCAHAVEFVHLAYHWLPRPGGAAKPIEGNRTLLPADLPPGGSEIVEIAVSVPPDPEDYQVVPDALQEGVAWFELPVTGPS